VVPDTTHPGQLSSDGSVGNAPGLVATVSQYRFAPDTPDQLNVGVVETPVAPSNGKLKPGADSTAVPVVKLLTGAY